PLRRHEQIAVFYKQQPTYNPQFTKGKALHGKGKNYMKNIAKNNNYGEFKAIEDKRKGSTEKYPISILEFRKTHPSQAKHPTEKPIELLENLIKTYSNEQDLILDSCIGSGSTAVACINTNRRYIGFEINKKYYDIAMKRIEEINRIGGDKLVR
ncbi:MAG: site-specific DNA-methyltransferase, partial [Clostridia bacterium]|nr:site-specific DNA-methyltransferase [Clostridia bacterium]